MEMKHRKQHSLRGSNQGFTMVELLVAMVVSLLALAAIYSTFLSQHRSYQVQEETADMQQNIRAAMYYMQREIRMAGSDPYNTDGFGISTAENDRIIFTTDMGGGADDQPNGTLDGDETITYNFVDSDLDGVFDELQRNGQAIAQNIDALDFVYLDSDGAETATLSDIRSVEITIVARTDDQLLYGTTNNKTYANQRGDTIYIAPGDNFSRRRLTTLIHCRNLGL